MGNMSYCRFENTEKDLRDCFDNFEDEVNEHEERARKRMIKICKDIVDSYGDMYESD